MTRWWCFLICGLSSGSILAMDGKVGYFYASGNKNLDDKTGFNIAYADLGRDFILGENSRVKSAVSVRECFCDDDSNRRADFDELYVSHEFDKGRISVGKQIVSWGKTVIASPSDKLSPTDYSGLSETAVDHKYGVHSVRWQSSQAGNVDYELLWSPYFVGSNLPLPEIDSIHYAHNPDYWNATYGTKINGYAKNSSYSFYYQSGPSLRDYMIVDHAAPQNIVIRLDNPEEQTVGFGFDGVLGGGVLRADIAYSKTDIKNIDHGFYSPSSISSVVEYEIQHDDVIFTVDAIYRVLADGNDSDALIKKNNPLKYMTRIYNGQYREHEYGSAISVVYSPGSSGWRASAQAVYFADGGSLIKPYVKYAISDHYSVYVGGEHYTGPEYGILGRLTQNSHVLAGVEYFF